MHFKLHAGAGGGIHQSWCFLFLNFCILLDFLSVWSVYLFLLLPLHLDSFNLWPSFLLSFFFPSLKNLIPFSSLRYLIQSLPSGRFLALTSNFWSPSLLLWPTFAADGSAQHFLRRACHPVLMERETPDGTWGVYGLQVMSEELTQLSWLSFRIKN